MSTRDYQTWAEQIIWQYFAENTGNPVIAMPTGTGKSHVISNLLSGMIRAFPSTRAMVLTHVKELVAQNYAKFLANWPTAPAGVVSAGLNKKEFHQPIIFGGIGSVAKHAARFGHIDLLFIDECDLVNPTEQTMYKKFIDALRKVNPHLKIIGLTATPWRAGFGHIVGEGGIFTDVPVDMTSVEAFNWFIEEGYLVPLVPRKTVLELNTDGVHMRGGEFISGELQAAVDKADITVKALREAMELAADRDKWLIFASGVEHAKNIADMLTDLGITCKAIYSGMPEKERDAILEDFKNGTLRAVSNNNVLTTGFDNVKIDLILMLRPTGSARLWVQMLGRGTRPWFVGDYNLETKEGRLSAIFDSPKHNCLVLDFAGNTRRLGPINDPVMPRKKGEKAGEAPVKLCTACNMWNHASVRYCGGKAKDHPNFDIAKGCGTEFVFVTKLKQQASTADLIKAPEFPVVESAQVSHITYELYNKPGKPDSIIVTYYCGMSRFKEFLCPEYTNYAGVKAAQWWRMRSNAAPPKTTEQWLRAIDKLPAPTHLQVWINKKYPEIMKFCFDGTNFGTIPIESVAQTQPPSVEAKVSFRTDFTSFGREGEPVTDVDDIPF